MEKFIRANEKIRISPVLLIDDEGKNLGSTPTFLAQKMADEKNLDLVEINPSSRPPVCKIMDFGKYKYELAKKEKERKSKQHEIELKEIRLTAKISDYDLSYKAKQANEFFKRGDRIKISLRLRGRENAFSNQAFEVFKRFSDIATFELEGYPKKLGNTISAMVLRPKEDKK